MDDKMKKYIFSNHILSAAGFDCNLFWSDYPGLMEFY